MREIFSFTLFLKWCECEQGLEEASSGLVEALSSWGHYARQIIKLWRGGTRHCTHNLSAVSPSPTPPANPSAHRASIVSKWPDLRRAPVLNTCNSVSLWLLDAVMDEGMQQTSFLISVMACGAKWAKKRLHMFPFVPFHLHLMAFHTLLLERVLCWGWMFPSQVKWANMGKAKSGIGNLPLTVLTCAGWTCLCHYDILHDEFRP